MSFYTLIKRDGTKQQVLFLIQNGSEYVTQHFSRAELDTGHDSNPIYFDPMLQIIEKARDVIGKPITGLSGYRSVAQQTELYNEYVAKCKAEGKPVGGAVAPPGHSPHMTGAAADLKIPDGYTPQSFRDLLQSISNQLGFKTCRIGWKDYLGQGFVHMDVTYLLYAPYTSVPNPEPEAWVPGVCW